MALLTVQRRNRLSKQPVRAKGGELMGSAKAAKAAKAEPVAKFRYAFVGSGEEFKRLLADLAGWGADVSSEGSGRRWTVTIGFVDNDSAQLPVFLHKIARNHRLDKRLKFVCRS